MPRWRKPKADAKKVVTKKEDAYFKWPISSYHIVHKEWIEQFVVYSRLFRVPIFIYIWDIGEKETKEFFEKEREKYGLKEEFKYNCWWKTLSEPWFGHLIWIKDFSITTLVHELCHVTQNRIRFCGMELDDEWQAYFLQSLIDEILVMDKEHKFKFYEPLPLDD